MAEGGYSNSIRSNNQDSDLDQELVIPEPIPINASSTTTSTSTAPIPVVVTNGTTTTTTRDQATAVATNANGNNDLNADLDIICALCHECLVDPRLLQCLHSFCLKCLESHVKQNTSSITCPICANTTSFTVFNALPETYWAPILIAARFAEKVPVHMDKCGRQAIARCQDCFDFICDECATLHKTFPRFRDHKIFDIKEYVEQPQKQLKHLLCSEHNKPLEAYCRNCSLAVCLQCAVFKHNGHLINSLPEATIPIKANVQERKTATEGQLQRVQDAVQVLSQVKQDVLTKQQELTDSVHELIQKFHEMLNVRRDQLISYIETAFSERVNALDWQTKALHSVRGLLDAGIRSTDNSLRYGCDAEVVALAPTLVNRLDELIDEWAPLEPCCGASVELAPNKTSMDGVRDCIGTIADVRASSVSLPRDPRRPSTPVLARNYASFRHNRKILSQPGENLGQTRMPFGLCESSDGGVMVCDFGNHRLVEVFLDDRPARLVATYATNKGAVGICKLGDSFATVDANHQLKIIRSNGTVAMTTGGKGSGATQLHCPFDVRVLPSGQLIVSDQLNNRLQIVETSGKFVRSLTLPSEIKLNHPRGLAVDKSGRIYITDHVNDRIVVVTAEGALVRILTGRENDTLSRPFVLALDDFGNVLVADWSNSRIVVFQAESDGYTSFGTPGHPRAVAVTTDGCVLVGLEEGQLLMY